MSASSKKQLRHSQDTAKMTERQIQEQKEAKKLKLYTALFVTVLCLLLVAAITVGAVNFVTGSGIRENNTVALTVGEHEISNAELNYYYVDVINNFLGNYGDYITLVGLDPTKPLNEQYVDEAAGVTWADDFLNDAKQNVKSVYAMVDAAEADGFTLTEEQEAQVDQVISNIEAYAMLYGFPDAKTYLKGMYGNGANLDNYKEYCRTTILADSYYSNYVSGLTYEDADLRAHEAEDFNAYSSYSFNYYFLSTSKFLKGGTTGENNTITYSDEEKAASVAAAEEAANSLVNDTVTDVETFDKFINAMDINAGTEVKSVPCNNYRATAIIDTLSGWVSDESRVEGEMAVIPSTSTTTDADGNEVVTTTGYYVVFFRGSTDNIFPMVNARHILIGYQGGTTDPATGATTYTDEEKKAAYDKANEILNTWKEGEATEDSFAALANEHSTDTGSNTNGGLYLNIFPGAMVEPFENWCFEDHKYGDTGLVESPAGVHVMYYVGETEQTYRDYMITNDLITADTQEWYNGVVEAATLTDGDTKYIAKDLVISAR